jgi:hypothetical protein
MNTRFCGVIRREQNHPKGSGIIRQTLNEIKNLINKHEYIIDNIIYHII